MLNVLDSESNFFGSLRTIGVCSSTSTFHFPDAFACLVTGGEKGAAYSFDVAVLSKLKQKQKLEQITPVALIPAHILQEHLEVAVVGYPHRSQGLKVSERVESLPVLGIHHKYQQLLRVHFQ